MGRPNIFATKTDKVVHIDENSRRFYYAKNDQTKQKTFLCKGKDDTCIKAAMGGGICYGCGAVPPKCKYKGCPNNRQRGGFCVTHGVKPPRCTGVEDDGRPCPNQARKDGLCRRHGSKDGMCHCGKERIRCPTCKPLGHLRHLIRIQVMRCSPKLTDKKTPTEAPECLGCTGKEYDDYLEDNFEDGMTWDNYGQGEGKWTIDHILAYFSDSNPATTKEEVLRRSHYTNTKPMWWVDNMSKGIK